ncbi:MAG: hypothetical protein ACYTGZ_15935 [Planctomycetota bacterium]|jgi:hypothetical protein
MAEGWQLVLNPDAPPADRAQAWEDLTERVRRPVVSHLRRCMEGFREPERIADDVLAEVQLQNEGSGATDVRLRACVAAVLDAELRERGIDAAVDDEFDRDWASSLLFSALHEMKQTLPRTYALLLRLYDRPEGEPPLDAVGLAERLEQPVDEVQEHLVEGRAELQQRFLAEVRNTVADAELAALEAAHLLQFTRRLFGAADEA